MSWIRISKRSCFCLLWALVLARTGTLPVAGQDASRPSLAIELLELNDYSQLSSRVRDQARTINGVLGTLESVLEPYLVVEVTRGAVGAGVYRLSDPVMTQIGEDISLTVRYRGPDGFEGRPTAWYREPCSDREEAQRECTKRTAEERAVIVVANLLNQTLVHWKNGIFRPFEVRDCKRQSLARVRLTLSPPSLVEEYREPASWFEYRPSVLQVTADDAYPEQLALVLGPLSKEGEVFVFERRYDPGERFDALCETEGPWMLEHQYPGTYLYRPPAVRHTLPAINAAPVPQREEP